ncbi:2,3-bisphosphoglycerate-dependent phosphoglycerate mutase [Hymenobacter sp. DH14]|uniref:2,3-bisphosphoglycerate-dependent phosphoglycerate mutase n=1 Tax=Hymenobacter cyanobacteriorum TaxID=2926463 RepID=A0A9X1VK12_9BACT|nr:2,3-bisphosphoglycerate-dependent phosphoglycerate mutase [Hymenobacter cyanobacteriorum]MCI1189542.1 2,3-bisphosphoglycerate-dependent phosphoglycerate mutase [Hymenobacter cyanobacteriorum]
MALLVLVRHGESTANLANVFTGWLNVALSPKGEEEALVAAEKLRGFHFDAAYSSDLLRSERTLDLIVSRPAWATIPVHHVAALRERMYGDLQGLNKAETALKYGQAQIDIWRRSYAVAPPGGESLQQTQARVVKFYDAEIVPQLRAGRDILLVAHGNTLRALRMYLEQLTPVQVESLEIVTGGVHVYRFGANMQLVESQNL